MKCPHCQAENRNGATFCRECGQPLQMEIACLKCGHVNPKGSKFCDKCGQPLIEKTTGPAKPTQEQPTSFANGRYQVKKFLGEGGKKKVYLAHDTVLDRDVAFALIKTEKLDENTRMRIKREAQAMGKLGDHPNIVTIHDMGEHEGQPYIVLPVMAGGDVEGVIEKATDHRLPLDKTIEIAKAVCKGLEFAHSKGIIHRDLKPGNVWLSADGTAKIGDFGLAVVVDLSRLTQSGMMVGTVAYMPPEQAMGGKVTAKADLYSLGAMLYEMVTGRPPFIGDDSVSIIGQHINTPPVSPAWHRADLPPALDTLIMQLLEKDSDKRPESATVVLQALEAIGAGTIKEPSKEAPAENPLYRRVFVGREPELKQLQTAFDGAMSGQGALVMVMGEPGIGKTALCEQLSTYVTLRGGRTLVGHCYEEGSLSLPYLAFVEAMRSYVLSRETKDLREELGTGATDVARIVSEIREKLKVKPRPQKDPEEERYRLMQAVTSFLTNAASVQPLLIVLEDLHDADKGTLDMLTHVSRHLSGTRLLIVGTYRDIEVDRSHPLSAALAELRRVATYNRVILRGLNADEVRRMLESITRETVPWRLAEAVHRQTEGNPLFVQEVVRFLSEEGLITRKEGRWRPTKETPLEMNIPEGLRDVIGKRLSLLSKECNQLLSVASVIGREFQLEVLQKVTGLSDEELFKAIEEAKKTAVIEERAGFGAAVTYRFAHAFFRQTLYEETIAPRRIRLHQQVARALEEIYAKKIEEHAAELAEHFSHSSDTADLKKAVSYGEMAAKRATDVYAYGEAVRLLEQAIKVQEILDPGDKTKRCDLLLTLCDILLLAAELKRVEETEAPAALSLAESMADENRASKACISAIYAISFQLIANYPPFYEWAEKLDRYARPGTIGRAYADCAQATQKLSIGDVKTADRLFNEALAIARSLGTPDDYWITTFFFLGRNQVPQLTAKRTQLAEELWATPHHELKLVSYTVLDRVADVFLALGQRKRAEEVTAELRKHATRSGFWAFEISADSQEGCYLLMDGRFTEAREKAERARSRAEAVGNPGFGLLFWVVIENRAKLYLGLVDDNLLNAHRMPNVEGQLCLLLTHMGKNDEALTLLGKYVVNRPGIGSYEDRAWTFNDAGFLEAAVLLGHRRAAELLLNRFKNSGLITNGFWHPTCIPRHLGGAAALLGRYDEARRYYQEAIKVCTEMPFRPELALTRLQLAELLLEHYPNEKKEALEHLDFAIKEFREMKMQPSLERALRHKDILKA
jgi:tetratricopeptide (TPR) repeat protein/ribosomal protein L40E